MLTSIAAVAITGQFLPKIRQSRSASSNKSPLGLDEAADPTEDAPLHLASDVDDRTKDPLHSARNTAQNCLRVKQ